MENRKKNVKWLAKKTGYSVRYIRVLAPKIPGAKNPSKRNWIFPDSAINYLKNYEHLKEE